MDQQYADSGDYTYLHPPTIDIRPWPDKTDARLAQLELRVRQLERDVHKLLNAGEADDPDCDRSGSY